MNKSDENKLLQQKQEPDLPQKSLQSTIESWENQHKRIAAKLHDEVGAMLSAAKLNLAMIYNGTIPKEEYDEAVTDTKQMIDDAIEIVRSISNDLLPTPNKRI